MKKSTVAFAVLETCAAFACAQDPAGVNGRFEAAPAQANNCPGCTAQAASDVRRGSRDRQRPRQTSSLIYATDAGLDDFSGVGEDPRLSGRAAYLGLSSELGGFTLGRQYSLEALALTGVGDPFRDASVGSASSLIGSGGRRADRSIQFSSSRVRGITTGTAYGMNGVDGSAANRAWGMSIGIETGPLTLRVAHQNRHVARVRLYDLAGNNMEAKNSIIAANVRFGWGSAYAAYSANRGWGSSPLFNPDNPYGASVASTPSTDSRDVLVGVAMPVGKYTTLLASFIHKNDRDLANRDANQLAIGATYSVSRRTDFYAAWSHIQNTSGGHDPLAGGGEPGATTSALNIGMRHAF
jgi:predicted porin